MLDQIAPPLQLRQITREIVALGEMDVAPHTGQAAAAGSARVIMLAIAEARAKCVLQEPHEQVMPRARPAHADMGHEAGRRAARRTGRHAVCGDILGPGHCRSLHRNRR